MSRVRSIVYIAAAVVLLAIAFWVGTRWGHAPAARASAHEQRSSQQPPGVVVVPGPAQEQSGLATATVSATTLHPVASAYAIALDVRPLLAARRQVATGEAQVRSAESAERASHAEYERARKLFADDRNVSQKTMQSAEAAWHADQGKVESARAALREGEAAILQQFGPALAGTSDASSAELRRVAAREQGLVLVTLPASSGAAPALVTLSAAGYPTAKAQRIGPSPQVDAAAAGRAFLYRSYTAYPSGLRLQADVPLAANALSGFLVPGSAVVWYGNEPWVFVQTAADRFVRKALEDAQPAAGGVFTTTSFGARERIVTRGAQLLQSESLKPKVPAGFACSDPECDD